MRRRAPELKLSECPTCGSENFREVVEDVFFSVADHQRKVPAVRHYRCFHCGERVFDLAASEKIDQYCLEKKLRRAG